VSGFLRIRFTGSEIILHGRILTTGGGGLKDGFAYAFFHSSAALGGPAGIAWPGTGQPKPRSVINQFILYWVTAVI
jgi:hypothetical protein